MVCSYTQELAGAVAAVIQGHMAGGTEADAEDRCLRLVRLLQTVTAEPADDMPAEEAARVGALLLRGPDLDASEGRPCPLLPGRRHHPRV